MHDLPNLVMFLRPFRAAVIIREGQVSEVYDILKSFSSQEITDMQKQVFPSLHIIVYTSSFLVL